MNGNAHAPQNEGEAGPALTLNWAAAEERYHLEPCVETNPESLYERRWALDSLDHVLDRLRAEAVVSGREAIFDPLQRCLLGEQPTATYAQLGTRLNQTDLLLIRASLRHRHPHPGPPPHRHPTLAKKR